MDIHFYDENDEIPVPLPRDEVRFTEITPAPYFDGRRVKLEFKLTPFLERPDVEIYVTNLMGEPVAALSLIEAMDTAYEFTLHLRGPQPQGEHTVHLIAFYTDTRATDAERHIVDEQLATFVMTPPAL